MKKNVLLLALLYLILLQPTIAQKKKWAEAKETHTIEAYKAFIKKYPKSDFIEDARTEIDILEKEEKERQLEETRSQWETAKKTNTLEGYKEFQIKNYKSEFSQEAQAIIEEMEWKIVEEEDTRSAYEKYLRLYKDSKYATNAKEKLKNHTYRPTSFTPNGRTTVQGNKGSYMRMSVFKSFFIDSEKRDLVETLIGKCVSEESTDDGLKKCTYEGISFWTENEKYYWEDQGNYNKSYEPNEPRTLILYYDSDQKIKKIEVGE